MQAAEMPGLAAADGSCAHDFPDPRTSLRATRRTLPHEVPEDNETDSSLLFFWHFFFFFFLNFRTVRSKSFF
jgi:hypothetical protein